MVVCQTDFQYLINSQLERSVGFYYYFLRLICLMNKKSDNSSQNSIFRPISQDIVQKIRSDTLSLHSTFWLNGNKEQEVHVVMTSSFIALCEKAFLDFNYLFYTPLDFDLKFEVLGENSNPENLDQNSIFSKPTGFRLVRQDASSIDFQIVSSNVLGIWLKYLTKMLNQIGFHNLFKPLRKLGKGGFATVYEVQRLTDNKLFAVKAFSKQNTLHSKNESHRLNLLNEIAIMRSIDNSNLIRLEGVFESSNSLYVVLELLTGGHLHSKINKRMGKFTITEIKHIMIGLIRGLKELHDNNIMHRDIKPENIMLRDELEPVLVDFGLAANVHWDDYVFYRCGTPGYVAPEVTTLEKGKKIAPVCDIFSAGVIFHILLTSKPLFEGKKFDEVYQNNKKMRFNLKAAQYSLIDPEAMDLLQKMLALRPEDRLTANQILMHPFLAGEIMVEEKDEQSPITNISKKVACSKVY